MKNILYISIIAILISSLNMFAQNSDNTGYKLDIKNETDAQNAYGEALYYKERALASGSLNENSKKDLETAINILKKVIKYLPNKEIYVTLADTYEAIGDFKSSADIYDKLAIKYQNDDEILIKAAERQFFLLRNIDKALYYLNNAYEINTENNDALILIGYIYYESRDYQNAIKYFSKVDETKGASANYLDYYNYYYAISEFYSSMFKNALYHLKKLNVPNLLEEDKFQSLYASIKSYQALEDYKAAYSNSINASDTIDNLYLSSFLSFMAGEYNNELFDKIDPMDMNTPKVIAIVMVAHNDSLSNALDMLEIEIDRGNIDLDIAQTYYSILQKVGDEKEKKQSEIDLISFYMKLENIDAIDKHLDNLLQYEKSPLYINLYLQLAYEFSKRYDEKEAKLSLEKYLSLSDIKDVEEREIVSFVNTACNIEEYDLAIKAIEKFEKEKSSYSYLKAYVFARKKDYDNSRKYLEEDYSFIKNNEGVVTEDHVDISYATALAIKDKKAAEEYAEYFLDKNPDSPEALNNMAWGLIYLDIDVDKGIELVEKAIKYTPNNVHYIDTLGMGYYRKGDYNLALKTFLKAAFYVEESTKAELYSHLADAYYAVKDYDNALKYYRKSIAAEYKDIDFDEVRIENAIKDLTKK